MGTVVSETIGANAGLGYQIALAGSNFQMPLVFAALLLLAVEGIVMYAVFAYVEVYFTGWAFRSSSMSAAARMYVAVSPLVSSIFSQLKT